MDHLFVGLDVAKDRLDIHVRPAGETFSVSHDEPGLTALVDRLRSLGFRRMRTRLNFRGKRYLAEKETWIDYAD